MQRTKGFTLVEVMIVVVVIGILASIAYPSYTEYVFKARRADGQAALMEAELAQQKRRAAGLGFEAVSADPSPDEFYSVVVTVSGNGFTATATPQGKQAGDSCGNLLIVNDGTSSKYEASGGDNAKCWGR